MLNDKQLAWLRDELGPTPPDEDLNERFERLGSVRDVALSVLRERRAALLQSPLRVNVNGVASIDNAENVKALERRIAALSQLDPDPTDEPGEDLDGGEGRGFQSVQLRRTRGR